MKRIWLLTAIMVLTIGCSENTVVENDTSSESAMSTTSNETKRDDSVDTKTESANKESGQDDPVQESANVDSGEEVAPGARDADKGVASEPETPESMLLKLQEAGAEPEKFLEFAEEHRGKEVGLNALKILAQRRQLAAEPKSKLMEMAKKDYLLNKEAEDSQVLEVAMMLAGEGGPDHQGDVVNVLLEKFVAGQDKLNRTASRVLGSMMQQGDEATKKKIADQLVENFANNKSIIGFAQQLTRGIPSTSTISFLESLAETSENDGVKGTSMMSLAQLYTMIPDFKGYLENEQIRSVVSDETFEFISSFDADKYAGKVESLLTEVAENYGDVKMGRGTLGEMAEGELFAIKHLSIGKEAPDILGEDLDGEEFKLSDYRGKVVMLDFWGDW